jgi:methylated-DNA-[protein]-cysteine S-methyltransferase
MRGRGYYTSPVGELMILSVGDAVTHVLFNKDERKEEVRTAVIEQCIGELDEYFKKGRKFFTVELKAEGTEFQKRVWAELLTIPFGKTISYEELALRLGDIKAIRAAAVANSVNPIAVIIPCHRVIGKNGELTGYAGGLDNKQWLLFHEGSLMKQLSLF